MFVVAAPEDKFDSLFGPVADIVLVFEVVVVVVVVEAETIDESKIGPPPCV